MRGLLRLLSMTPGEYRANIEGMNIFFGAVLGVVMATTDRLGTADFAVTLALTAGLVITLLYVSSSRHRLGYAVAAGVMIAGLPRFFQNFLSDPAGVPPHLQPTLAVWLAFLLLVEFAPREREEPPAPPSLP